MEAFLSSWGQIYIPRGANIAGAGVVSHGMNTTIVGANLHPEMVQNLCDCTVMGATLQPTT